MKRGTRITLEILGPPAIGALSVAGYWAFLDHLYNAPVGEFAHATPGFLEISLAFLGLGYISAIIPSVIYMTVMERSIRRGWFPTAWRTVGLSSLLGLGAGSALGATEYLFPMRRAGVMPLVVFVGLWTGFVMGLVIKGLTHWGERKSLSSVSQPGTMP